MVTEIESESESANANVNVNVNANEAPATNLVQNDHDREREVATAARIVQRECQQGERPTSETQNTKKGKKDADAGNRTQARCLEGTHSTTELHPL